MPYADVDPGIIAVFIPIVFAFIPIIAILTKHQRSMAEIIHKSQTNNSHDLVRELSSLRYEVAQLRERVNEQTIALDAMNSRTANVPEIAARLENSSS